MSEENIWQEWNDFIRIQKHWMLNQFQIVMGYIQIGKPELAFNYIKKASNLVQDTTAFSKMQDAEFGVRLCLIWWNMCEGGIMLRPIINEELTVPDKENFFKGFTLFMDDLKVLYLPYLGERTVNWQIITKENTIVSILKCVDDCKLPNLYVENMPFQGKINVEDSKISYTYKLSR